MAENSELHRIERLRLTHGEPMAYLCNYLPPGLLDLDTAQLEATGLYRLMRAAGITLHSARQTIGARAATAGEAARLGEEPGAPCSPCGASPSTTPAARSNTAPTPTAPPATRSSSNSLFAPDEPQCPDNVKNTLDDLRSERLHHAGATGPRPPAPGSDPHRPPPAPHHNHRTGAAQSHTMSTYRDFTAPIGSRRAPVLRTVGTRERRSS
ncbi:hypothetical protein SHKM778_31600 [Streptomyces sp. KM77-8]|uniref:UbiC transcription regulator-associated domain-containing protein n=1 Tax=Streptomyces haneummycinicus TaxID=3074435 RepID=A0AAT9HHX0_9ACTN